MKRITIKEKEWGADFLRNPDNSEKCCLGFACLALGEDEEAIKGLHMPTEVGVTAFERYASDGLIEMANNATTFHNPDNVTISTIAAQANDEYHHCVGDPDPTVRKSLLAIMRRAFKEAGFVFVLRKS